MISKKSKKVRDSSKDIFYDGTLTPEANYLNFENSISFYKGMEFYSSIDQKPEIYLANTSFGNDIQTAKSILNNFYNKLRDHLNETLNKETEFFKIYRNYFHLYNAVAIQYNEYQKNKILFYGPNMAMEHPYKKVKQLNVPILRSYYKSPLAEGNTLGGIQYDKLGIEIKTFLAQLYKLKKRANMNFMKELAEIENRIFFDRFTQYYRYAGETTDIIEMALILLQTKKLQGLDPEKKNANKFCKDLCYFFGVPFTKLSNYLDAIANMSSRENLFIKNGRELIKNYLIDREENL